jgi:hypothetical protein
MKKPATIFAFVLFLLTFFFFYFFFVLEENKFLETIKRGEEKNDIALVVNDMPVTEEKIERYIQEISRNHFEENLSSEEARELAIEKAIREVIMTTYFAQKGITISKEEFEEELLWRINRREGVETKEEYYEVMAMQGISQVEAEKDITITAKKEKLITLLMQDIEITEKELFELFSEELKKGGEDIDKMLIPFGTIRDSVQEKRTREIAEEIMFNEIEQLQKEAEIEIIK